MYLGIRRSSIMEGCCCSWAVLTGGRHFSFGQCLCIFGCFGVFLCSGTVGFICAVAIKHEGAAVAHVCLKTLGNVLPGGVVTARVTIWFSLTVIWVNIKHSYHCLVIWCHIARVMILSACSSLQYVLGFFSPSLCRSGTIYLRSCLQPWIFYSPSIRGWKAQAQPLLPDPSG